MSKLIRITLDSFLMDNSEIEKKNPDQKDAATPLSVLILATIFL